MNKSIAFSLFPDEIFKNYIINENFFFKIFYKISLTLSRANWLEGISNAPFSIVVFLMLHPYFLKNEPIFCVKNGINILCVIICSY